MNVELLALAAVAAGLYASMSAARDRRGGSASERTIDAYHRSRDRHDDVYAPRTNETRLRGGDTVPRPTGALVILTLAGLLLAVSTWIFDGTVQTAGWIFGAAFTAIGVVAALDRSRR